MFFNQDLLKLADEEIRHVRGAQISMIFQDPMTSLNPVLTIGMQMEEPMHAAPWHDAEAGEQPRG